MRHSIRVSTFLLLIFISSSVCAQDTVDAWRDPTNPELYSQRYSDRRLLEQRIRKEVSKLGADIKQRDAAVPHNLPTEVALHVKKEEGIAMPTAEELVDQNIFGPEGQKRLLDAVTEKYDNLDKKPAPIPLVVFPKCTQPKRERLEEFSPTKAAPVIYIDRLYISKSDADDMDLKEFGELTESIIINPAVSTLNDEMARLLGANCLPTRFLTTSRGRYKLEGTEALKNFDKDPAGNGEIPAYLKSRLDKRSPTIANKGLQ